MSTIIALLSLTLMALSSLLSDGSARFFEVSSKKGVAPYTITFNSNDLKQAKLAEKFIWTFGDGQSLTTTNTSVAHAYLNAGTFTANLKYLKKSTDAISKAVDAGVVKIVISPKPNILPTPNLACTPSSTSNILDCNASGSTDADGVIASFNYEWGDGTNNLVSNSSNVSHTYLAPGEKTVKLTVTDNKGGVAFVEKKFILKPNTAPVANFTCTKNGILKIHCESTSSDAEETLSNFQWTLDDGTTYTAASFDHSFIRQQDVAIASHNVQLTVTDSLGLTGSISQTVAVDLEPIKEAPRGYFRIFEAGTEVELHAFIAKTQFAPRRAFYQVYGSTGELLQTIELPELYPNTVVKADLANYGNYRIFFTVIDWRDQIFKTSIPFLLAEDTTKLKPYVDFRAVQSARRTTYLNLNLSFDFDLDFSIKSYVVNFGDGQQVELTNDTFLTHTYSAAGTYQVSVTAITNHNTQSVVTKAVTVTDEDTAALNPDATFGYRIFSYAQNVSFYNERSGTPNGEIVSYLWSFGDGSTGTGATQAHFYEPGSYAVSLTVTDTAGLTSTQTQKITIKADGADLIAGIDCTLQSPFLDFTQKCKVLALDRYNDISRVRVLWGDGTVTALATPYDANQGIYFPTKKYATEGDYVVKVVVNTNRGDVAGYQTNLNIVARRPVASLNCYPNNLAVYCDALGSYDPKGSALVYKFDFGNGVVESNSTGMISYAYPEAGLYNVSVTVTDTAGLSALATTQVQAVKAPNVLPVADFLCESTAPLTMYCWENGIYDQDGTVVTRKLSFDDGNYDFLNPNQTTYHRFATGGEHEITLSVIDNDGGVTTKTRTFNVLPNKNPIASMECASYAPQEISCYSTSTETDPTDYIVGFDWDFGDGGNQNGLAGGFTHTYSNSVEKTIKLTVNDQYGGSAVVEKNVKPRENLVPVANIDCQNTGIQTITCDNFSYDPDGQIVNYLWELDDNASASGHQITHTFVSGEVHNIKATMIDNLGAKTSIVKEVRILFNQLPTFAISANNTSGVIPLEVNFKALDVIDSDGTIASYKWIFGDGSVSDQEEAIHIFTSTGSYNVKLQITDNHGGMTEKSITIIASKLSNVIIDTDKDNGVANLNVHFDAGSSSDPEGEIEKYEWFYQGKKIAEGIEIDYEFDVAGEHYIELTVTNNLGFKTKASKIITVLVPPIYLDGRIESTAFVNREYKISLNLVLDPGVVSENISFELQNAPQGVSFDQETMQLTWIPKSENVGVVSFYLDTSDGVLHHRRLFKIAVHELTQIASFFTSGNGEAYILHSPDSPLDNTSIYLPSNDTAYSIKFFQATTAEGTMLITEPSSYLRDPLVLSFTNKVKAIQRTEEWDASLFDNFFSNNNSSYMSLLRNTIVACPREFFKYVIFENEHDTRQNELEWNSIEESIGKKNDIYSDNLRTINVRIVKNLKPSFMQYIPDLLNQIKSLSSELHDVDIYILDSDKVDKRNKGALGFHSAGDKSTFFLNIEQFYGSNIIFEDRKHTILHEYFHVEQSRAMGCIPDYSDSMKNFAFKNIKEGSADYAAFLKLSQNERKNWVQATYARELSSLSHSYEIGSSVLARGGFSQSLDIGDFSYRTRIMWDYLNSDLLSNFWLLGNDLRAQSSVSEESNKKILRILKQTTIGDISANLLDLTDGINNYNSVSTVTSTFPKPLMYILKDLSVFTGWVPDTVDTPNLIKLDEMTMVDEVVVVNIGDLPAISGVSKTLKIQDFISKLSYVYSTDVLDIEIISDNPDVKMRARSVAATGSALSFKSDSSRHVWADFKKVNHKDARAVINIVNSGLNAELNVKFKIRLRRPIKFNLAICNGGYPQDRLQFSIKAPTGISSSVELSHLCTKLRECTCDCTVIPVKVKQVFHIEASGEETLPPDEMWAQTPIKPLETGNELIITEEMGYAAERNGTAFQYYMAINDYTPPAPQEFRIVPLEVALGSIQVDPATYCTQRYK